MAYQLARNRDGYPELFKKVKAIEDLDYDPGNWCSDIPGETVEDHFAKLRQYDDWSEV